MWYNLYLQNTWEVRTLSDSKYSSKDDFWAIEKLVPKREKPTVQRAAPDTSAVEITSDGPSVTSEPSKLTLSRDIPRQAYTPTVSPDPDDEYSPTCPLIEKVSIYRWKNNYNYYEDFRRDAKRYYRASVAEATHVPYFSYVPQYVQLNRDQLRWYVYWRGCVRRGVYLDTDYSYILLLITEIINLSDEADTKDGQRLLFEIYKNYSATYPRICRYLSDWICDYSLIHHLPPPEDADSALTENCSLREFYVFFEGDDAANNYARLLIKYCSSYDYKKSKFAAGDNLTVYDLHVAGALAHTIDRCSEPGSILSGAGLDSNMITRDAYSGALCSSEIKRRLKVKFFSFSRSHELRFLVADIIKYSENKIRAYLGVKSRLSVFGIPDPITRALDEYFAENLPVVKRMPYETESAVEDYDRLYELPHAELSLENAEKIEKSSWNTTQLLVEAFDGEAEISAEPEPVVEVKADEPDDLKTALGEKYEFVLAALQEDLAMQKTVASRLGLMPDALADMINDIAADIIGDIILEDQAGGYTIIEDYKELFDNE